MFAQIIYNYAKNTGVPYDINEVSDFAFTVIVHRIFPRFQHEDSVALETHQLLALPVRCRLRDKLM